MGAFVIYCNVNCNVLKQIYCALVGVIERWDDVKMHCTTVEKRNKIVKIYAIWFYYPAIYTQGPPWMVYSLHFSQLKLLRIYQTTHIMCSVSWIYTLVMSVRLIPWPCLSDWCPGHACPMHSVPNFVIFFSVLCPDALTIAMRVFIRSDAPLS